MSETDGGPAFPATVRNWNDSFGAGRDGMSLRDFFAAHALAGVIGNLCLNLAGSDYGVTREVAERAYFIADTMLERRAARKEQKP